MAIKSCDIQRATLEDAAVLADLAAVTLRETYSAAIDPADVERHIDASCSPSHIRAEIEDANVRTLVARVTDLAIGYATLRLGTPPACVTGRSPIELARLYLSRYQIGKGYGSDLMRACLEESRTLRRDTVWLSVWERNERARSFYEVWGFEQAGTCEFLFGGKPYDDLVLVKNIERAGT